MSIHFPSVHRIGNLLLGAARAFTRNAVGSALVQSTAAIVSLAGGILASRLSSSWEARMAASAISSIIFSGILFDPITRNLQPRGVHPRALIIGNRAAFVAWLAATYFAHPADAAAIAGGGLAGGIAGIFY